jgi:hypothetical protein
LFMMWPLIPNPIEQECHKISITMSPKINLEHILDTMKCHY